MSSYPYEQRREATHALIQEAYDMLPGVEGVLPSTPAMSRAILDRLYVPAMDGNELVVPPAYQNDDSIPVVVLAPGETVCVSGAASTLTTRQQEHAARALHQVKGPTDTIAERVRAIQDYMSTAGPQEHTMSHDAQMEVNGGSLSVGQDDGRAVLRNRPLIMIRDDIMIGYNQDPASQAMRRFRTMGGIALLHETMHVDQAETTDAATIYRDAAALRIEGELRAEEQRANGELRAYAFQRALTQMLRDKASERYDVDTIDEWYRYADEHVADLSAQVVAREER